MTHFQCLHHSVSCCHSVLYFKSTYWLFVVDTNKMLFHVGAVLQFSQSRWNVNKEGSDLMCWRGLVSWWRHWPNLLVSGYNECHPGPQQVLHCCMGPGIIWIGACAIAICPSPSSIPANCHTGVHKHCCPSAGQNTGQGPSYSFGCIQKNIFWSWTHFCRQISQKSSFSSHSIKVVNSAFNAKQ